MLRRNRWKTVLIIVLCVALVAETAVIALKKGGKTEEASTQFVLTLSMDGMGEDIGGKVGATLSDTIKGLVDGKMPDGGITGIVKTFVYSDMILNSVMSISFPLLLRVLTDIKMLDFCTAAKLYPTPVLLAPLMEGKPYTCCDATGTRKPLSEVLAASGEDWKGFDAKINWTDDDGKAMNTTMWNSIKWNITDEASFFTAMNDMSEGLRGVLEVCLQNNEMTVNVNVFEALMGKALLPINLDAAVLFNGTGASGYKTCLIPLFNMLGLDEGDYVTDEEFKGYTNLGDMWKAIFGSVMKVIEKTEQDPVNGLTNMLVNFADAVESGTLVKNMRTLSLDADFNAMASLAMGYKDGPLSNLGQLLIGVIESMGIKISGNFNQLLDSLPSVIPGVGAVDLPDMDVERLKEGATTKTLANGNTVYVADSEKVVNYLAEYIINEQIVQILFDKTDFLTPEEENAIVSSLASSKDGIAGLVKTAVPVVLSKLDKE